MWIRIVIGFTFAVFEGGFTLWASIGLGLSARDIGLVLAYVGVIQVVIQMGLIGPLTRRFDDPHLIVGASALAASALAPASATFSGFPTACSRTFRTSPWPACRSGVRRP